SLPPAPGGGGGGRGRGGGPGRPAGDVLSVGGGGGGGRKQSSGPLLARLTRIRGREGEARPPSPARSTTPDRAASSRPEATATRASGPSPRAWRSRPAERASPRSGTRT